MSLSELQIAKDWKKIQLRQQREPLLARLDVEFIRLLETGSLLAPGVSEIIAKKQALRDVTNLVDAATTVEEVAAVQLPE